jgi:hypothetical protein
MTIMAHVDDEAKIIETCSSKELPIPVLDSMEW